MINKLNSMWKETVVAFLDAVPGYISLKFSMYAECIFFYSLYINKPLSTTIYSEKIIKKFNELLKQRTTTDIGHTYFVYF
jgi:hypothetical protein